MDSATTKFRFLLASTLAAAACDPGSESTAMGDEGGTTAGFDAEGSSDGDAATASTGTPASQDDPDAPPPTFALDPDVTAAHPDVIELVFPARASDLRPGHYWQKHSEHGANHDLVLRRFDEDADKYTDHYSGSVDSDGPSGQVGFGTPVYAGVDGEVISCWRDYKDWPLINVGFDQFNDAKVDNLVSASGNHVIIKTSDNVVVSYAHFQNGSVPWSICPRESVFDDGWLSSSAKSGSYTTESYFPPGTGTQIKAGQFIGRMGHTGNSSGTHLHVGAADVTVSGGNLNKGDARTIDWSGVWAQPRTTTQTWAWDRLENEDLDDLFNALGILLLLPGFEGEGTLAKSTHATDFDGNDVDDLFCFNSGSGGRRVDVAEWYETDHNATGLGWPGLYGSDSFPSSWCAGEHRALHTGDFNGDLRGDLLCHNNDTGGVAIDYAGGGGVFGSSNTYNSSFCINANQQVFVADFNDDGKDDLLCHNYEDGTAYAFYADNGNEFNGGSSAPLTEATASWTRNTAWCFGAGYKLRVGDFDGDGAADQMCRKAQTGRISIRYADGSAWSQDAGWCSSGDQRIFLGDFNGDQRDDILCFDQNTGRKWVFGANAAGKFSATSDWSSGTDGFCTGFTKKLVIGDFTNDGRDDLMCLDTVSGAKQLDWRGPFVPDFHGTDRVLTTWCGGTAKRTVF